MFDTLILQYLNKLVKGEVRDFPSPQAFHTIKVQRLSNDRIKPFAQVGSNLVMPVLALVADFPIEPGELANSTPPIPGTFLLARKGFVQGSEFFQGAFQKLRRLFLFPSAKCQVRLQPGFGLGIDQIHSLYYIVYSYALTCSRTGFGGGVVCNHVKPIGANTITKYLNIANFTVPVAVLVKREIAFVELQRFSRCVPRFEREPDTPCLKEIRRLELRRAVSSFALELWKSTKSIKETFVSDVNTDNYFVKRITGYPCPVLLRAFQQVRQMRLQAKTPGIFAVSTVISLFQPQKVVMHVCKIVKHIPETHSLWVFAQLERVCSAILFLFSFSHGVSRITPLSPYKWEASQLPSGNSCKTCQRDTSIKPQLRRNVKCFFKKTLWPSTRGRTFLPLPLGFTVTHKFFV